MDNTKDLPELTSDYALEQSIIDAYRAQGHTLIRGLASAEEVSVYRDAITRSTDEFAKSYKPLEERDTYGKAFIQHVNLWVKDETIRRFTLAKRFAKVAADLMGVNGVRIYHDQALYKEPGGGHTPWHQDQQYWPLDGAKAVTLWMPLVDITEGMGSLKFASKSQELGYLGAMNISDDSETQLENLVKERGYQIISAGDMKAGDATFHDGWCIHGAPGNSSTSTTREVMTVIYIEDGVRITEPDSKSREMDLASWFPGLKAGDLAASEINPLVYSR
jgi:ectoine hydroxylase-related dioxygenase (phytanoyl-CoA dioxygenase family)